MQLLTEMKNSGMSWEEVGKKLGVSGMLAWKVCKGICKSNRINAALGLAEPIVEVPKAQAKKHYPNPRDKGRHRRAGEFTEERATLYDAMLADLGTSTTDILNGVLDRWIEFRET
jgi:hypothetical protein